jgi:hypothetical protein
MNARLPVAVVVLLAFAPAAVSHTAYPDVIINDVPHVRQRPDFCGEACVEMVLRKLGKQGDQDYIFNMSGLDPQEGRGCYSADLARALKRIGFDPGEVFFTVDAASADAALEEQWKRLHADLVKGIPSIVCMHYDASTKSTEHMRLVVGYSANKDEVIYLEPAEPGDGYRRMSRTAFLALWPLKYDPAKWLVVRFRMTAHDLREPQSTMGFTNADYVQRIIGLKKQLPEGFTLFIERPFVVIGNGQASDAKKVSEGTVRWAVERLKKDYFLHDPDEIITIWLFKDDASYRQYAKSIFGDEPSTPYGYYSSAHRALIMNIATGTGTLVHEIVHPFVHANFDGCPAWFNEGLGSLYEQSGDRDGHIVGYPNWRLAGLQRAIKEHRIPSFKELTATTDEQFYGEDRGTNYSQARYLCFYLQEQGKLTAFYHEFVAHQADDSSGYQTLVKTLDEKDMDTFQAKWEKFVLGLKFP